MHTCQDCDHQFFTPGQSDGPSVQPAAQCPNCHSYRTQPGGIPDEQNDMNHGIGAMPTSTQDDMSGNPLKEGILSDNGWLNRDKRDEAFASTNRVRHRADVSLFETPEFETTQIVAPPDLYRDGLQAENSHHYAVQIPKGVTDNLHATLGNLQAWVENPYENGQLRPYNQYWKVIRPSFMKPGSIQIGVADPTMAEIINHVAHNDDLTPLYEYRGKTASTHTAGPLLGLLPEGAAALFGGGAAADGDAAAAGTAAELAGGADAAASAGAAEAAGGAADAGTSSSGIGGMMNRVLNAPGVKQVRQVGQLGQGLNYVDDFLGGGAQGGGGMAGGVPPTVHDMSYYAATDEDDAHPEAHDEIPKNDDGDAHEQDDGNNHEWQRDISVNGMGGADHSPSFQPGGPAMQRFMMLAPLLLQLLDSGQSGADDPLVQGLHQSLEAELPGYLDHGDDHAAEQLIVMLRPKQDMGASPEENAPDHTDENAGGAHESRVASLTGEVAEFLPDLQVGLPALHGARTADMMPMGAPPMGPPPASPLSGPPAMPGGPAPMDDTSQGPVTDAQQAWFANWLDQQGRGDEISAMLNDPALYAKEFALARGRQAPPQAPDEDAGMSANPPMPAQENAPPGDTMPVPGMEQQMMSAVQRYAADSVASQCPKCESHTTELLDEDGTSGCHGCGHIFKTKGKHPKTVDKSSAKHAVMAPGAMGDYDPLRGTTDVNVMNIAQRLMQTYGLSQEEALREATRSVGDPATTLSEYGPATGQDYQGMGGGGLYNRLKYQIPDPPQGLDLGQATPNNPALSSQNASTWNVDEDLRKEADSGELPSATDDPTPAHGVPIADQQHQRDVREEQDSGHTWTDEDGNPLQVGSEYEMYTQQYDIPDLVRIEAIKPTSIVYSLTGEYGFSGSSELTKQEANIEGTTFKSTMSDGELGGDPSLENNDDDHTGYSGEPERTDLSAPSGLVSASVVASGVDRENPTLDWLKPEGGFHTAGANYTPMEQRALIDEMGEARNADRLDLSNTHYIQDAEEDQFLFGL